MPELTIPPASASGIPAPPSSRPAADDAELQQFIAAHNLRADLDTAIAIVREAFPARSEVAIRLWHSPEEDDTRVVLHVRFESSVADASARYSKMLDRWTLELPLRSQGILTVTYTPC